MRWCRPWSGYPNPTSISWLGSRARWPRISTWKVTGEPAGHPHTRRCTMAQILIVEDDSDFRDTLVAMLDSGGHEVRDGGDGREALDILATDRFDLLIMDVLMPEVDGIEVLRAIQE